MSTRHQNRTTMVTRLICNDKTYFQAMKHFLCLLLLLLPRQVVFFCADCNMRLRLSYWVIHRVLKKNILVVWVYKISRKILNSIQTHCINLRTLAHAFGYYKSVRHDYPSTTHKMCTLWQLMILVHLNDIIKQL